ncbi:MAG: OmpA family protein [Syntrophales bacterium]|jgi:OOP family OmpA-OmpF porin
MIPNSCLKWLSILVLGLTLFHSAPDGFAAEGGDAPFTPANLNPKLTSGEWLQRVDNFLIILDNSGSMRDWYLGQDKFTTGKDILNHVSQTIPDMKLNGTLRIFGLNLLTLNFSTIRVYGPEVYTKSNFAKSLSSVTGPLGGTPLQRPIKAAVSDLKSAQGQIAVIIVSDGEDMDTAPVTAAENMKNAFGDRVCVYTVQTGDDPVGKAILEQIVKVGGCGFYIRSDRLSSNSEIADFVEKVFLTRKPLEAAKPIEPPPIPPPPPIKSVEAPKEVRAEKEAAPVILPAPVHQGAAVVEKVSIALNILFDTGKSDIKTKYHDEIKKVANFMIKYPKTTVVIEGHTDNVGKKIYNKKLSIRRAESVRTYLVEKFGIDRSRTKTVGYGMDRPVAGNKTAEGRQKNRRMIAVIETAVVK